MWNGLCAKKSASDKISYLFQMKFRVTETILVAMVELVAEPF